MRIAITGGTGFVGGHLAEALAKSGHEVVVLARGVDHRPWAGAVLELPGVTYVRAGTDDEEALKAAFQGCTAVAHCAGINREIGAQTYENVHVRGTAHVVRAAQAAGVQRLALVSFLRARPDCGSGYAESKWEAEELVRNSTCHWTVLKPGMVYGRGDHMLDHLSHALHTFPIFLGIGSRRVRPLAVEDLVKVLVAVLVDGRLARETVGVVGPTELGFDDAARLVAEVVDKHPLFVALPLTFHRALARVAEVTMAVPLISLAQVRILEEEVVDPLRAPDSLPPDLVPTTPFDKPSIRAGLPPRGGFGLADFRLLGLVHRAKSSGSQFGTTLIFDGDCGFCTTAAKWAERGFRHGERVLAWQFLGTEALQSYSISPADAASAAWWVDSRGTRERGHRAIGHALLVAGGWKRVIGWSLLLPPTSWLASGVYRLVVRYRYRLPGGTPACRVGATKAAEPPQP